MDQIPVITIDGPSGAGKGTISTMLAEKLGFHFLDSGALYRLTALAAKNHGVAIENNEALALLAEHLDVVFEKSNGKVKIILEGAEVTEAIRTETVGGMASKIAPIPEVRAALLNRQRAFQEEPGLVADGRDMGTIVFPNASLKVFLTASAEERGKRRYLQLKEQGLDVSIARLTEEIKQRDERDCNRPVAPLKPADDARVLDSSDKNIDEVFAEIMNMIAEAGLLD